MPRRFATNLTPRILLTAPAQSRTGRRVSGGLIALAADVVAGGSAAIAAGYPVCAIHWHDQAQGMLNRFISVHALGFVWYNMCHLANWIINGLPERFPKLKVIWLESGLAWIPFMMQRFDNEYMMRTCCGDRGASLPNLNEKTAGGRK